WPSASRPIRTSSSACRLPTTARSTSSSTRAASASTCSSASSAASSDPLQLVDDAGEVGGTKPTREAVVRLAPVRPHEVPDGAVAEDQAGPLGLPLEIGAVPLREPRGRDRPDERPEPVVDVEHRELRHRERADELA